VLALVEAAGLAPAGIVESFPTAYAVVRVGSEVVAVAGLEAHGGVGLLRSVAVRPAHRNRGLGRLLVEDRLRVAVQHELGAVYLLTTTAADYFRKLGFIESARDQAPAELQRSPEFASCCPGSAVCLARRLPG
jgi:amino-acid N-acetyltransferase